MGDAKNKSLYFGINPSVPVTSSRNCSYPPLHVAPLGLKMVSPYDSPSHSPTQNPASSSTCSSLSPASTNSVASNSDDSQISKVLSPQFYQQQQDNALISSSSMNTNQHHYHSEASRGLHYTKEKTKRTLQASCHITGIQSPTWTMGKVVWRLTELKTIPHLRILPTNSPHH